MRTQLEESPSQWKDPLKDSPSAHHLQDDLTSGQPWWRTEIVLVGDESTVCALKFHHCQQEGLATKTGVQTAASPSFHLKSHEDAEMQAQVNHRITDNTTLRITLHLHCRSTAVQCHQSRRQLRQQMHGYAQPRCM